MLAGPMDELAASLPVLFAGAAVIAVVISVAWATSVYQVKASKMLRDGGAVDEGDEDGDIEGFLDRLDERGEAMLCPKCGTETDDDHFDFADTECTNCGYVGMPMITDDTD